MHGPRCAALLGGSDPEFDALRVPGAGDQGAGALPAMRSTRRASHRAQRRGLHRWAWCCPSWRSGLLMLACAPAGEQPRLGLPAAISRLWWPCLAALFTVLGLNLAGVFESRQSCCPRGMAAVCRRATRCWTRSSPVCWRWRLHRPARRLSWALRWAMRLTLPAGPGAAAIFAALGLGLALPFCWPQAWVPAVGNWPCHGRARGWTQLRKLHGFPMLGHRGVAGVGAGPSERCRWRRCSLLALLLTA